MKSFFITSFTTPSCPLGTSFVLFPARRRLAAELTAKQAGRLTHRLGWVIQIASQCCVGDLIQLLELGFVKLFYVNSNTHANYVATMSKKRLENISFSIESCHI